VSDAELPLRQVHVDPPRAGRTPGTRCDVLAPGPPPGGWSELARRPDGEVFLHFFGMEVTCRW